jgi:hypothetical protein
VRAPSSRPIEILAPEPKQRNALCKGAPDWMLSPSRNFRIGTDAMKQHSGDQNHSAQSNQNPSSVVATIGKRFLRSEDLLIPFLDKFLLAFFRGGIV